MSPKPSAFYPPRSPRRVTPFRSCATELAALDRGALFQLARSLARRAARALGRRERGAVGDDHFERQATGLCLVEALGRIPTHRPLSPPALELAGAVKRSVALIADTWEADTTAAPETGAETRQEAADLVAWLSGACESMRLTLAAADKAGLDEARAELGAALRAARCVAAVRSRCAAELAWQQAAIAATATRGPEVEPGPALGLVELRAIIKNEPQEMPALTARLRERIEDGAVQQRSVRLAAAFGHPVAYALFPEPRRARLREAFESLPRDRLFELSARSIHRAIAPLPPAIRAPLDKVLLELKPGDAASLRALERAALAAAGALAEAFAAERSPTFDTLPVILSSALRGHIELARALTRPWSPAAARAMAVDASLTLSRCIDLAGLVEELWGESGDEAPRARAYRWQRQLLCRLLLGEGAEGGAR